MIGPSVAQRRWLPFPVAAVQVRVVLDAGSDVDALEEALLGLLRIAPRDGKELARRLHLSESLVTSALAGLVDRELVRAPDDAGGLYACDIGREEVLGNAARRGWAFYSPGLQAFLPVVLLAEQLPRDEVHRPAADVLAVDGARPRVVVPDHRTLNDALRTLHATRAIQILDGKRATNGATSGAAVELDGARLRALEYSQGSPRLRSLVLEPAGARRSPTCTAWLPVDLLPRMRGRAVVVVHEPVIDPAVQPESLIVARLPSWLDANDTAAWSAIQQASEQVQIDLSLVLTRAGITSEVELDDQVRQHLADECARVGIDGVAPPPGDQLLLDKVRDAQRWLVLGQREASYRAQARDAWAHAVEELGAALVALARPHLDRWIAYERRPLPTVEQAKDRLQQLALAGRLEPSEGHLLRSLNPRFPKDSHRSVESFRASLRQAPAGVGSGVTQWLLPLVLLENEPARRYAVPVQRAVQHHPDLFPDLAKLIDLRDYAFHEGRTRAAESLSSALPEHCGRTFMAVFAALHAGLAP